MAKKVTCCLAVAISTTFLSLPAHAVDFNWNVAGPADWNVGTNWDPEGPPSGGGGNHAFINNGGTAEISADIRDIQDIFVGRGAGTSGTLNHTGGSTFQGTGSWVFVGREGGIGTYNLSGAANNNKGQLVIGEGAGSVGEVNVTGDAHISATDEIWVGNAGGSGTLKADSGTIESDTWIAIGRDSGTGVANLSGNAVMRKLTAGNENSDGAFIVVGGLGAGGSGTLNVSENALVESDTGLLLNETDGQAGIVNQSGGTVTLHDYTPRDFQPNYGQSLSIDPNGHGGGEYHLSGGSLNAETILLGSGLFDMTGGVLSATNFLGNLSQGGGTTSPGSSPGTMTVTGDYSLDSGDLFMELDGSTAGTGYDQLIVTGDVSLAGNLTLAVGFTPSIGEMFTIIDNQGANAVNGAFTEGSSITSSGLTFGINYMGGDGNDVVLTLVPEPTTAPVVIGICLAGLMFRRRR